MKLFTIIKERGELCNFYTGLISCNVMLSNRKIILDGVLQYSQYERIGRYSTKEPEKFITIKEYIKKQFGRASLQERENFKKRLLDLTSASHMWVHQKSWEYINPTTE